MRKKTVMGVLRMLVAVTIFLDCAIFSSAQIPLEIKNINADKYYFIRDISFVLSDSLLSIENISKADSNKFRPFQKKNFLNFGFVRQYLAIKFKITNKDSLSKSLRFVIGNFRINEMEFFSEKEGVIHSFGKTGRRFPFAERPFNSNYFTYPLSANPAEETTYYLFLEARGTNLQLFLILLSEHSFNNQERRVNLSFGIFIGILLLTAVLNFLLFITNREKVHLAYSLYSVSSVLLLLTFEGFDQMLFPTLHPYFFSRSTLTCVTMALLLWVMQLFLKQSLNNSRFYRLVNYTKWLCIVYPIWGFYISRVSSSYTIDKIYVLAFGILILWAFLLVIASSVEKLVQGFKLAVFYLVAIAMLLTGGSLMTIDMMGGRSYLAMPPNLLEISMVIESLIICFGILYRYILYKREKDQLLLILQKQQLEHSDNLIALQEAERKRIAEDLHDELGSSLAALKLRLQKSNLKGDELSDILNVVDTASADTRYISHNLMPPEFEKTEFDVLLANYYSRLNSERGINFHFYYSGADHQFSKNDELILYRIIMELTSNILKHAEATDATIQLIYYENYLKIMTEDNGKGMDGNLTDGIGLKNIQSRVSYLNGGLSIDTGKSGTTIMIQIPYKNL